MILFELDPNVVRPGWTPLLILIALALVMVLLFRSMRRQFRRVDENFPLDRGSVGSAVDDAADPGVPPADAGPATDPGSEPVSTPEPGRSPRS